MENIILQLGETNALSIVMWILVSLILFLLVRELMLWYWKINKNTESLGRIADSLEAIANAADFIAANIDTKKGKRDKPTQSPILEENNDTTNKSGVPVVDNVEE